MKRFIVIGICLLLGSTIVRAEDIKYVTDINQITMRTGQGLDHKILAMLRSGQSVAILQPGDQWTMIRLPDGKEGWVLSRFLTSKKPNRLILEDLKNKNELLSARNTTLTEENEALSEKTKKLGATLAATETKLQKQIEAYETLKKESADYLKLKADYKKTAQAQTEMEEKTNKMEETLTYLQSQHIFRWFLAGAGVLLLGFIIGFSARRPRRRPSLL